MKKKIGLITFHASHNCGSMLQAYALQNTIKKFGHDVEIIDFSNSGQQNLYKPYYRNGGIKNMIKNMIIFPHMKEIKNIYDSYEQFLKNNFSLSKRRYKASYELMENDLPYDEYVCGSDQIWNITIEDSDDAYFLPFVQKHKKIAYAPSFGAKNPAKYANSPSKYGEMIGAFDYLSTRECNGQKWIKELTGRDVPVVLDPTLLLNISQYSELEQRIRVPKEYIFYYAPGYMKDLNEFVCAVSKKYNLPVIVFNRKQYYVKFLGRYDFVLPEDENPGVYLYLIRNAKIVMTTSFHGTIFSTVYRKNFWILKNGGMYGDDDRVKTLIKQLGIEDRLIVPDDVESLDFFKVVDYGNCEKALPALKNKSLDFLRTALDSKYEKNQDV